MSWSMDSLFELVISRNASDVLFVPGAPPVVWVAGRMHTVDAPALRGADVEETFLAALDESQRQRLAADGDLDFSLGRDGLGRLRINLHYQRGSLSAAVRHVPREAPSFGDLKLPETVLRLAELPSGLVLIVGGAGTGKSTTLAAMVDYINQTRASHVITLEDPIEYTFRHKRSIIEQREIGIDSPSFASALRHVVRQRPDVILVGEMRDLETISAALTAAETGHLVLASLHTSGADETINRIIDVFPAAQQQQVRVQLADTLRGVICQTLLHDETDNGLVPATECLMATPAVKHAIRDKQQHLLRGMMETGGIHGMCLMETSITQLVRSGRVARDEALAKARDPMVLGKMIG
ncbi:MAG: type IV pilus twitching motility protein PilT [Planctomycetota bacterium]